MLSEIVTVQVLASQKLTTQKKRKQATKQKKLTNKQTNRNPDQIFLIQGLMF